MKNKRVLKCIISSVLALLLVVGILPLSLLAEGETQYEEGYTVTLGYDDAAPADIDGFIWVVEAEKPCLITEHTHSESCYKLVCVHVDGGEHTTDCYSTSTEYEECTHESDDEHTGSVTLEDVVKINGTNVTWNTEHSAYETVYAAYVKANEEALTGETYTKAYDSAYKLVVDSVYAAAYAQAIVVHWGDTTKAAAYAEKTANSEDTIATAKASAESAAKAACAAAAATAIQNKSFCFTTSLVAPDQCTHEHTDYDGDCYNKTCLYINHTHNANGKYTCHYKTYVLYENKNNNSTPDKDEAKYTVKYVVDDKTVQESTVLVGLEVPSYTGATPTKEKDAQYTYTFNGWSTDDEITDNKVSSDITYVAQFSTTTNQYTVTWNNWDGTELDTDTVDYGTQPSYTGEKPTKAGDDDTVYHFAGWTPEIKQVEGAITYTAVFTENSVYEVTFNITNATKSFYVENGKTAESYAPVREYYTVNGWYTDESCTVKFDFDTAITGDIQLYGEWVPNTDINKDGVADELQACTVKVTGDVTSNVTGTLLPGETVVIEATPADGKYVTGNIKVNGVVYTGNVSYKETTATFSYTIPASAKEEATTYTVNVETAEATISLYSDYIVWNELMSTEETIASIFSNVNWGAVDKNITTVEFYQYTNILSGNKVWLDIGGEPKPLVGHAFGDKEEETLLFTFDGNDQIPPFTKEFTVKLKDERYESKITVNDTLTFTYSPSVTQEEMAKAIFDGAFVKATSADGTVTLRAVYGDNVFVKNAPVNAGTYTVVIDYYGTSVYAASSAEVTVVIEKADSYVNVTEQNVKYGTEVNASALIDSGLAKRIELAIGLSMGADATADASTVAYLNLPMIVDTDNETVNKLLDKLTSGKEMTISELASYLNEIVKAAETAGLFGIELDTTAVDTIVAVLTKIENLEGIGDLKIIASMGGTLKLNDAGVYIVGGIVADANYNTSFGANYVVITPDGYKAELGWNKEDSNGIITKNAIINGFDFGAHVEKVYEGTVAEAEKYLTTFFIGVNANGEVVVTSDSTELEYGIYTQVAMLTNIGNTMYYAKPIVRIFTVTPQVADVEVIDKEVVYNGKSQSVNVNVTLFDGSAVDTSNLTVTYVGVDTKGNVYNSTTAPVNAGVYTVYATYISKIDGKYEHIGVDTGVLVIKPATASIEVADEYVIYDGKEHMPTITNDSGLTLIKVIVDENNNVNVVLPDSFGVGTKTVDVAKAIEEIESIISAASKGYATAETIYNKLVSALEEKVDLEKLAAIGGEDAVQLLADLKAEAAKASEILASYDIDSVVEKLEEVLDSVTVSEISINGKLPVEDGVYTVTVIGYGANYIPTSAQGTLEIHKHTPAEAVIENDVKPDCKNPGSYDSVVYCDECGTELSRETIDVEPLGHDIIIDEGKTPTCTEPGLTVGEHCSRCDYKIEQKVIEAPGHDIVTDEAVPATCESTGLTAGEHCSVCDYKVAQEVTPALGHNTVKDRAIPATCTGSGLTAGEHCTRCDYKVAQKVIAALGHLSVVDEGKSATCTETGLTNGEHCLRCDYVLEQKEIPALGHNLVTDEGKAATCTETGLTDGEHCTRCDYKVEQEVIPALGHNIVAVEGTKDPTCTEPGLTDGEYCTRCDYVVAQEVVPALGHDLVTDEGKAPTCTETGLTDGEHCTRCDHVVEQEVIPALGHDIFTDEGKAPTCTETGLTDGEHCTRCDYKVEQEVIPALGHDWKEATTEAPKTCDRCGATEGDPLPKPDVSDDTSEDTSEPEISDDPSEDSSEPEESEDTSDDSSVPEESDTSETTPETAGNSSIIYWLIMAIASILVVALFVRKRAKNA